MHAAALSALPRNINGNAAPDSLLDRFNLQRWKMKCLPSYIPSAAHLIEGDIDDASLSSGRSLTMYLVCAKLVVRIYCLLSYFLSNNDADVPSCLAVAGESLEMK